MPLERWLGFLATTVVILFAVMLFRNAFDKGTLVIDNKDICYGKITRMGYPAKFECEDGRVIYNPMNYQIRDTRR